MMLHMDILNHIPNYYKLFMIWIPLTFRFYLPMDPIFWFTRDIMYSEETNKVFIIYEL